MSNKIRVTMRNNSDARALAPLKARIASLAASSACMAVDDASAGRPEYATLDDAAEAYLNNLEDTLREWGVSETRHFVLARQCFAEAMRERGCERRWVKP